MPLETKLPAVTKVTQATVIGFQIITQLVNKYMQKIKYFTFIILTFSFLNIQTVFASSYTIHLYYDTASQKLSFDKFADSKVSLDKSSNPSILEFVRESDTASGAYVLTFYETTGNEIISTKFDVQSGAFQLAIPFFSTADKLTIFKTGSNEEVLSTDLSAFTTCNGNGICEYEKGETLQNCLGDCDTNKPSFSPQTLQKLKENNGTLKDPATGELLLRNSGLLPETPQAQQPTPPAARSPFITYIYIVLASLVILILLWLGYKKFIKNKE
jgi:hypothetical protein